MADIQLIQNRIYEIRSERVMLDFDLAQLYGIETRVLKQAVRRNIERFPDDFMFRLTAEETKRLIHIGVSQSVIPQNYNSGGANIFAFTEQGVAMLSSVLRSKTAIEVNIVIMRAFVAFRRYFLVNNNKEEIETLKKRIQTLEDISDETLAAINDLSEDTRREFDDIYMALLELSKRPKPLDKNRRMIGFKPPKE